MSDPTTPPAPTPHVLSADDLQDLMTYDFTVANGPGGRPCVFKMRRLDMMTQLLEEVVPAPLLRAATQIFEEIRQWAAEGGEEASFSSLFEQLDGEKKRTVLEQLRAFACQAVLQPRLVPVGEAPGPGEFPVALLSAELLFAMWNYTPPQAIVRRLSEVAAADFRPPATGDALATAPAGEDVRPATVDLAAQPAPTRHA